MSRTALLRVAVWSGLAAAMFGLSSLPIYSATGSTVLLAILTTFNPAGVWLADNSLRWFFDTRGIAPSTAMFYLWNAVLLLAFVLQWMILSVLVVVFVAILRGARAHGFPPFDSRNFL